MQVINSQKLDGNGSGIEPTTLQKTDTFIEALKTGRAAIPRPHPIPIPRPVPWFFGSRFMIWKQDPSVEELGYRLTYLPGFILNGPRDIRIDTTLSGTTPVERNAGGDFIFDARTAESDCAHSFAVVKQTLLMYQRLRGGASIPWAWNTGQNTSPVTVFPRGFAGANAYYSRRRKAIKFGFFNPGNGMGDVYNCRSLDIVAHETAHAILDGLKPGWLGWGNPPQTGGLHEAFGDLSAIFLALSQFDQVDMFIAMTKGNLHAKNFLAAVAERFGNAIGRPYGLRNADNDLKLSEVSNQVHDLSKVFTGAIYDILADIFAFERRRQFRTKPLTLILFEVSRRLCKLLLDALIEAPAVGATYTDVANKMLEISDAQDDPAIYRTFIRNRFAIREVVTALTPLTKTAMALGTMDFDNPNFIDEKGKEILKLTSKDPKHPSLRGVPDFSGTCGTMQLPEYMRDREHLENDLIRLRETDEPIPDDELFYDEIDALKKEFK